MEIWAAPSVTAASARVPVCGAPACSRAQSSTKRPLRVPATLALGAAGLSARTRRLHRARAAEPEEVSADTRSGDAVVDDVEYFFVSGGEEEDETVTKEVLERVNMVTRAHQGLYKAPEGVPDTEQGAGTENWGWLGPAEGWLSAKSVFARKRNGDDAEDGGPLLGCHEVTLLLLVLLSQEDAMREICQLSMDDETFRFHEVFDVGHFRSELRDLGVQKTASFESFLEANGAIDTLFLLNAAFQPGGAWGQDSSVELDGPKFARELLEALRHGHRLAFQLYFWSGPERHRMSLQASQMAHVPSLWRAFKILPVLEELADDTIRGFLGGTEVPFVVAHWKWRDMSAGGLLEYFDQKKAARNCEAMMYSLIRNLEVE
eukprot:s272_g1.t1